MNVESVSYEHKAMRIRTPRKAHPGAPSLRQTEI